MLMVTALAPYKRVDQALSAMGRLGRKLVIIGSGPQLHRLRKRASGEVAFLGWESRETLRDHYRRCKALIFPGEEDFGIVPVEAMACGAPVIAYGAGGALETVIDATEESTISPTGLLYAPQTVEALMEAVQRFERIRGRFLPGKLSAHSRKFSRNRFLNDFKKLIEPLLTESMEND